MYYKSIDKFIIRGRNLQDILDDHKKWLSEPSSENAHLRADLSGFDLRGIDLSGIDLSDSIMVRTILSDSIMVRANLSGTDLRDSIMVRANLSGAILSDSIMVRANLSGTDLRDSIMVGTILSGAIMVGTILRGADLSAIIYDSSTAFFSLQCPEKGQFTGFKKCQNYIVELEIPADALRSSATSRKCRCSDAKVISITNLDGSDSNLESVPSDHNVSFIYRVGEVVSVPNFDKCRWNECSTGIHFFITREEAVLYQ